MYLIFVLLESDVSLVDTYVNNAELAIFKVYVISVPAGIKIKSFSIKPFCSPKLILFEKTLLFIACFNISLILLIVINPDKLFIYSPDAVTPLYVLNNSYNCGSLNSTES